MSGNINVRNIPKDLQHDFKVWCLERKVPMQDAVVALIEIAMERNINVKLRILQRKRTNGKSNRNSKTT